MDAYAVLTTFIVERLPHERFHSRFDFSRIRDAERSCTRCTYYLVPISNSPLFTLAVINSTKRSTKKPPTILSAVLGYRIPPQYECKQEQRGMGMKFHFNNLGNRLFTLAKGLHSQDMMKCGYSVLVKRLRKGMCVGSSRFDCNQ